MFYLGLIVVLCLYGVAFSRELFEVLKHGLTAKTEEMKIIVLDLVDIVMLANLVKMIITGSYNSFISKDHGYKNENISSGMLKIKISTSIIVVCMIHLLGMFVGDINMNLLLPKLYIFGMFLIAAIVLGVLEFLHIKGDMLDGHKDEEET